MLEKGCDQSVSWDAFPHHLGDGARAQLYNTAFLHLQVSSQSVFRPALPILLFQRSLLQQVYEVGRLWFGLASVQLLIPVICMVTCSVQTLHGC